MDSSTKRFLVGIGAAMATGFIASKLMQENDPRQKIIDIARGELGIQNPDKYWAVVQPKLMGNPTTISWCGGFALWALKQAGLAADTMWQIGKGFTEVNRLPRTKSPKPGDIAYFDQPYQHHAIVVSAQDGVLRTIDGNQENESVKERLRPISSATAFYSIEPYIHQKTT